MEENKKERIALDFKQMKKALWSKKRTFLWVWLITFVLSCLWILPQPRYYTASVSIAPESADTKDIGSLASLASSFGVNIGSNSSDAIYPKLYPDLFESTRFITRLLDIKVQTADGEINTDYYSYLKDHQKKNVLLLPISTAKNWVASLFSSDDEDDVTVSKGRPFNPFRLSKETSDIVAKVQRNVKCTYSMTTDVVTINVTDQDPLVCALLADSIKEHLQVFITEYRTKKARTDLEYYTRLTAEAKATYEKAQQKYAAFCDASNNVALKSVELKMEAMEHDMEAKFTLYTAMNARKESALAKIQERTPAFTELKNTTVPLKPAGPKRMIFVAVMLFLATIGTIAHICRKELAEWF